MGSRTTLTYRNPVWPHYFADPFVLKTGSGEGGYYAYGTVPIDGTKPQFPVLHSHDLVNWRELGPALEPLREPRAYNYWAPEVTERDGRFYMYYSATTSVSDEHHRLRVAVAEHPAGPFVDAGVELIPGGFSIDAHPFRDPRTGRWYLFYAADYTEAEPHGTGLAVVELGEDMTSVRGEGRIVLRASCPWQVYERYREYKGRVWPAWHCIEGPFVLYHEERYWCLYSGGAWHSENYGVGCAVADEVMGPYEDRWAADGPAVLRGTPEQVIGPGHNSVTIAPDGQTLMMVYHAWDRQRTGRRMCIDPLRWTPDGPRCDGPSHQERQMPGDSICSGGR